MDNRTYLAGMAMAGMLASQNKDTLETITNDAVIAADLLIKALGDSGHSLTPKSTTGSVNRVCDYFSVKDSSIFNDLS